MAFSVEVKYFNSFWLKKVVQGGANPRTLPEWPGLPWNPTGPLGTYPTFPFGGGTANPAPTDYTPWFVEEARIKGGFNNTTVDFAARAYITKKPSTRTRRESSLIYSGIFNSATNSNKTNVFSVGDIITRSTDPINGGIQRLYAEDSNLIIFQELKVSRSLIDKDTIYTAEGGTQTQAAKVVIGQSVPYVGEYGISKNPESFAQYGYRKYFVDKNHGCVLRLSRDGLTEISEYGMKDYFRDHLKVLSDQWTLSNSTFTLTAPVPTGASVTSFDVDSTDCCGIEIGGRIQAVITTAGAITSIYSQESYITNVVDAGATCTVTIDPAMDFSGGTMPTPPTDIIIYTPIKSKVIGGWDTYNKNYVTSLQTTPPGYGSPVRFSIKDGVVSGNYDTLVFDESSLGWTSFYTYKPSFIDSLQSTFYSFNSGEVWRHNDEIAGNNRGKFYNTTSTAYIDFIFNPNPSITKNFLTVSYEGTSGWEIASFKGSEQGPDKIGYSSTSTWSNTQDITNSVKSYNEGLYTQNGVPRRCGFDRKENRYVANLINNSTGSIGEVVFGNAVSGIKGFFATVRIQTDNTTESGAMKELFTVGSNYSISSY
tara:strand:+ start:4621 stop:6402 length:1782 start_codon:yes stop_codon:yes gene_type:complete